MRFKDDASNNLKSIDCFLYVILPRTAFSNKAHVQYFHTIRNSCCSSQSYIPFSNKLQCLPIIIPMFRLVSYLVKTIVTEIQEDIRIVKEIYDYHANQIRESIQLSKIRKIIRRKMESCTSYEEWLSVAEEFDNLQPNKLYRDKMYSPYYDYKYIQDLRDLMREYRTTGHIDKLMALLRSHSFRNIGNINSPLLYRDCYSRTKSLVENFQQQITKSLQSILRSHQISIDRKVEFFAEMRHALGRTALLLSGGAILGMYHIGVVSALYEAKALPRIIAGSSAGSMIAAFVATHQSDEKIDEKKIKYDAFAKKTEAGSNWRKISRFLTEGYLMDINVLCKFLRDNIGDITFQEAYDKTGWILNITVTGCGEHDADRLLNYLTAPNVLIWSACAASCAIPYVYGATTIYCKNTSGEIETYVPFERKFVDGSIGADLPMNQLSVFFNVNNFIVSQTNPWVIPFMDYTEEFRHTRNPLIIKGLIVIQRIKELILAEIKHRVNQGNLLGLFPSVVQRCANLVTQCYVGDITIWPVPKLGDYLSILNTPSSYHQIATYVEGGRARTYPSSSYTFIFILLFIQIQKYR